MVERTSDPAPSNRTTVRDGDAFAGALMELKRRGCCVLVTGPVNERTRAAQSRRLFGQSDEPRHRVFLLTDATPTSAARYLPGDIAPTHSTVTLLDHTETVRIIADTADCSSQPEPTAIGPDESSSMGALGAVLYDTVTDALRTDALRPGELRLGIATLGVLIDTDGLPATRAFVRAIRADMMDARGMAHFHLPGAVASETVAALEPLIDIHIELRQSDCGPQHRWHLLETGAATSWLRL